jgi:hypothetical protein
LIFEALERREHGETCETCHYYATCQRQVDENGASGGGECCKCYPGYTGNGKYCFEDGMISSFFL